ncbi:HNH endonuclease signature motif containing protein [Streptomyces virginiae]|uniref:HNH endonuclease signature motif containing protein n=1 Tax=Streptomyces virginiae TaxID=1961 RepID=UPI00331DAC67
MTEGRPDIPTAVKRAVLVEAGHRCAIPTCRQTPVELAHITPWAKVKEHKAENLIALCPTCHTRFDRHEIDRKSMLQYKKNLEVLNARYTDVERQILKLCAREWERQQHLIFGTNVSIRLFTDGGTIAIGQLGIDRQMWWLLSNLIDDGIVEIRANRRSDGTAPELIHLTEKGGHLVERIIEGEPI